MNIFLLKSFFYSTVLHNCKESDNDYLYIKKASYLSNNLSPLPCHYNLSF